MYPGPQLQANLRHITDDVGGRPLYSRDQCPFMLQTFPLSILNLSRTFAATRPTAWLMETVHVTVDLTHTGLFFSLHSHRVIPAIALFAVLAPGFRARKTVAAPLEAVRPESARVLLRMRRDTAARFLSTTAGDAALAIEHGVEDHLLVHYSSERGTLTIAGGWLGAGRRRYIWLPLRPSLSWNTPSASMLSPAELAMVAADLHTGLDQISMRHALEEFHEPAVIPEAERREVLEAYSSFMLTHGWDVSYDEALTRRSLKRTTSAENPERWSSADREALTRHEALVSEMLKGVRSSSRILYQTK